MVLLFTVLSVLYTALLLWLYGHWSRIPTVREAALPGKKLPSVAVIIPVRNEAATLPDLLHDLTWQTNDAGEPLDFDVLVVDDDSTDGTPSEAIDIGRSISLSLRVLSLEVPPGFVGSHKKLAIQQAIQATRREVIVTTDGDCRVGPHWLYTIQQYFAHHHPLLLSGPVTFTHEHSLFERLQTIEFASLIGTGAACLQAGYPTMGNGANLSFSRAAFNEVDGYAGNLHIPSGDDEFLLQKMAERFPGRVFFLKSAEATVRTYAKPSVGAFYEQRKRWASKWHLHRRYSVAVLAVFIFTYHFCLLAAVALTLFGSYAGWILALQLAPKVVLEYFFLRSVLALSKKRLSRPLFLLMQLIYSPYAVFFGMRANFGGYSWKQRTYF
jgi:cellulose synthase/poly-beta-1,6-N-acetylglucosamine synthase-like glycosyltransferase